MKKCSRVISIVAIISILVVSLCGCNKMDSSFLKETAKTMDATKGVSTVELNLKATGLNDKINSAMSESDAGVSLDFNFDDITIKVDGQTVDQNTAAVNMSLKMGEEFVALTDVVLKDKGLYINIQQMNEALAKILPQEIMTYVSMVVAGLGITAEKPYLSFTEEDMKTLTDSMEGLSGVSSDAAEISVLDKETTDKIIASMKNLINAMDVALTDVEPAVMGIVDDYYTLTVDANNIETVVRKLIEVAVANKADLVTISNAIEPDSLAEEDVTMPTEEEMNEAVESVKNAMTETNMKIDSKLKTTGESESLKYDMEMSLVATVEEIPVNMTIKGSHDSTAEVNVTVPTNVVTISEAMTAFETMMGGMIGSDVAVADNQIAG